MASYEPLTGVTVLEFSQCHARVRTMLALRDDCLELLTKLRMPSG
jgi:hypothetical protein